MTMTKPTPSDLFFKKKDANDLRLGNKVQLIDLQTEIPPPGSVLVLGYPDDEGIHINGGRLGAAQAPNRIRQYFYKTTWLKNFEQKNWTVLDAGDLNTDEKTLAEKHTIAETIAEKAFASGAFVFTLGGGHDYAFNDANGFLKQHANGKGGKPIVINFDAHLDVRDDKNGYNSGSAFYRMINRFNPDTFEFFEVGIQNQCNSSYHMEWAKTKRAQVVSLEDSSQFLNDLKNQDSFRSRKNIWLSLDIDVFSYALAPGCSQSWATGLNLDLFLKNLDFLFANHNIAGIGIYEVSPPLDSDNHTAKLAAQIMHHCLVNLSQSPKS